MRRIVRRVMFAAMAAIIALCVVAFHSHGASAYWSGYWTWNPTAHKWIWTWVWVPVTVGWRAS
jgi:hypothetical protein